MPPESQTWRARSSSERLSHLLRDDVASHPHCRPVARDGYRRPVSLDELTARTTAAYDALDLPSWPNPHPDGTEARDEEYSRVTDVRKYDVVHARARAWAQVLGTLADVSVDELDATALDGYDRGVRVTSSRPGTLPLLLLESDAREDEDVPATLRVAVVRPDVVVDTQPDCGCDACDFGSADLLDAVDQAIGRAVGGPYVWMRARHWSAAWYPDGGEMSADAAAGRYFSSAMRLCRRLAAGEEVRLPRGCEAFVGHAWLDRLPR